MKPAVETTVIQFIFETAQLCVLFCVIVLRKEIGLLVIYIFMENGGNPPVRFSKMQKKIKSLCGLYNTKMAGTAGPKYFDQMTSEI